MNTRYKKKEAESGVRLMLLLQTQGSEILRREADNDRFIHLYCTGPYWVAFEKSAYLLHSHCRNLWIFPIKVADVTNPIVMANIEHAQLEAVAKAWDCLLDEVYKSRMTVDAPAYQAWHEKEVEEILMAMDEGMIP